MYWAAGYVALRMKNIQILGAYERDATNDHAKNTFTKLMNMGGLTLPLKTWLKDYYQMEAWFQAWHPKGSVRPGRGHMLNFVNFLKTKFSPEQYDDRVLIFVTKVFTRFRIRAMNKAARLLEKQKKRGKKGEKTKRGRMKTVEMSGKYH